MDFTDQVAVVTGAASGIGRAIAVALARNGAVVIAADRDLAGAEQTAAGFGSVAAQISTWPRTSLSGPRGTR